MFRLQRQYPIICEFNAVLPVSQSLGNQQTLTSGDGGTSLENGNLRASLRGLRETLNLGEAETRGCEQGSRCSRPLQLDSLRLSSRRRLLASAPGGGDGKLAGVKELPVQRKVEFEGSAKVDFQWPLV